MALQRESRRPPSPCCDTKQGMRKSTNCFDVRSISASNLSPLYTPLSQKNESIFSDAFLSFAPADNQNKKEDALDAQEAAQQDARLQAAGVADIEEERATQIAAVADGVDPKKEAARIRERHIHDAVSRNRGWGGEVLIGIMGTVCIWTDIAPGAVRVYSVL